MTSKSTKKYCRYCREFTEQKLVGHYFNIGIYDCSCGTENRLWRLIGYCHKCFDFTAFNQKTISLSGESIADCENCGKTKNGGFIGDDQDILAKMRMRKDQM